MKILKRKMLGIGDWGLGIGPNPQSPIPRDSKMSLLLILRIFKYILIWKL